LRICRIALLYHFFVKLIRRLPARRSQSLQLGERRTLNIQSFELPLFETQFQQPQPDKTLHLLPSPSNSSARPPKSSNLIFLQLFIDTLKDLTIGQIFPILLI
jgi:hypothetical protein